MKRILEEELGSNKMTAFDFPESNLSEYYLSYGNSLFSIIELNVSKSAGQIEYTSLPFTICLDFVTLHSTQEHIRIPLELKQNNTTLSAVELEYFQNRTDQEEFQFTDGLFQWNFYAQRTSIMNYYMDESYVEIQGFRIIQERPMRPMNHSFLDVLFV
jgi:hypothetical protein